MRSFTWRQARIGDPFFALTVKDHPASFISGWGGPNSTGALMQQEPGQTSAEADVDRSRRQEPKPVGRRKGGREVMSYGDGRTCAQPACTTLLSRYNRTTECAAHSADY